VNGGRLVRGLCHALSEPLKLELNGLVERFEERVDKQIVVFGRIRSAAAHVLKITISPKMALIFYSSYGGLTRPIIFIR
jgi:hypothetical protein